MKKFIFVISGLVIIAVLFMACEELKSADDITFNAKFSADLNANAPTAEQYKLSIEDTTFVISSEDEVIDPRSNSDFKRYADKIRNVGVESVDGKILSINPDTVTLVTANIGVVTDDASTGWSFDNETIYKNKELTFDNSGGQWDIINDMLENMEEFTVSLDGEVDNENVVFELRITINTKVTADALGK